MLDFLSLYKICVVNRATLSALELALSFLLSLKTRQSTGQIGSCVRSCLYSLDSKYYKTFSPAGGGGRIKN